MVVYNAKILFVIESEHVITDYISHSYWDVMMYHHVLWLCLLKSKACGKIFFIKSSMSLFMLGQYVDSALIVLFFCTHMINVELV